SISFEQNKMKPDKDFLLYYSLSEKQFGINLVTYKKPNTDGFFMMMLSPKYEIKDNEIVKKDVVFVLDTSGSMLENGKIEQAKKSLNFCINSLRDTDRFNLVTFSGDVRQFKDSLQEATSARRAEAVKWVADIEARGGTNINDALQTVLGTIEPNSKRPFMIIFLTDGIPTIGEQNPQQILKNVAAKNTANIRIFTFGVGFDVNTHLLDKLAEANHGVREYITPGEDIEVKVSNFYEKIAYPVLSDIKVEVSGMEIYDRYPKNPADIFRGSQLVIMGRYKGDGQKLITLTGMVNGEPRRFEYESTFGNTETGDLESVFISHGHVIKNLEVTNKATTDFIPRIWATSKIGYLMDEIRLRGENKEVKDEIIKLAKEYGILTPYTSWLVVEDVRTASPGMRGLREGMRDKAAPPQPSSQPSGGRAVGASNEADALKRGDAGLSGGGKLSKVVEEIVKQIGDKTFYISNGIWYDSLYNEKDKDKVTKVKYLSDEYFDIIKKNTQLAKYFALGKNVVVCFGDKIYEIISE
ncbi:MAG: VWA domain-containing protein, partial [Planctomycetota bacterium]